MNYFKAIADLVKPVAKLIDDIHTSDEERGQLRNGLQALVNQVSLAQIELQGKALDAETRLAEAKSQIITSETKSESWITRNWRPVTMLTLLALTVAHAFGWTTLEDAMAEKFLTLVQIGLGGYITSRGLEKVVPTIVTALKS